MQNQRSVLQDKVTVLIVEDCFVTSDMITEVIKGYADVTWVTTVAEALETIEKNPGKYQLGFLDYRLPDGDTFTGGVMQKFCERNPLAAIILTSGSDLRTQVKVMEERHEKVVQMPKPFGVHNIAQALDEALLIAADKAIAA